MSSIKIKSVLGIFQDGILEEMNYVEKDLNFKLECRYLANIIDDKFSYFYGIFKSCTEFYFTPWIDDELKEYSLEVISSLKPDLINIEILEDDSIKIYCNCNHTYRGGNLIIQAADIKIFDEDLREVSLEQLEEISNQYWYSADDIN